MNSFLLKWVNKRLSDYSKTEKPNKKLVLEPAETVVKNFGSSDCYVHVPTYWN